MSNEPARALARVPIAQPVGIGAIVETGNVLAVIAKVSVSANASRHGIFQAAVAVEGAVVLAVLDAAIVSQEWWSALACAESVANALRVTREGNCIISIVLDLARKLPDSGDVLIGIGVDIAVVTAMSAVLDAVVVVVTDGTGAGDVGAVQPIEARVAVAESIGTDAVVGAALGTVKHAEGPQVVQYERFVGEVKPRPLRLLLVADAAMKHEGIVGLANED